MSNAYGYAGRESVNCRNCIQGCAGNCCPSSCCRPQRAVTRCETVIQGPPGCPGQPGLSRRTGLSRNSRRRAFPEFKGERGFPGERGLPGLPAPSAGAVRVTDLPRALWDRAVEFKGYTALSAPEGPLCEMFSNRVPAQILSVSIVGRFDAYSTMNWKLEMARHLTISLDRTNDV